MTDFIARNIAPELESMAKHYPIVTLIGPRQSGKSTLIRKLFHTKDYVSLEDPDQKDFATSDPKGFLTRFPDGAIIDEIQRVPELLSYLQGIVDRHEKAGEFLLTGSHQLSLMDNISQSLAGRTAIVKLLPFTMAELAGKDLGSLEEQLVTGFFPRVRARGIPADKFYRDYIQTYVERDVRLMVNIRDLNHFRGFLKLIAGRVGQIFNSSALGNELGVSSNTIKNWLSILEASFLIFRLPPYFENFGKRVVKSPKVYFTDVGLLCYLLDIEDPRQLTRDPLRGSIFENFIIMELLKHRFNAGKEANMYFYRDSNQLEVDLLLSSGSELVPVEIKLSQTFNPKLLHTLKKFKALSTGKVQRPSWLVYTGDTEQKVDDVEVINYRSLAAIPDALFSASSD